VSLASELIRSFEDDLEVLSLIPSGGGAFEIVVDGELLYSKHATGRHVQDGEVERLLMAHMKSKQS
jgi:selenoprotein W-related protein